MYHYSTDEVFYSENLTMRDKTMKALPAGRFRRAVEVPCPSCPPVWRPCGACLYRSSLPHPRLAHGKHKHGARVVYKDWQLLWAL